MKLKFIEIEKATSDDVRFSSAGALNFKKHQYEKFGIKEGSGFKIGYDEDEKPLSKLYFIPCRSSDTNFFIKKSKIGSYYMNAKVISKQLEIKLPIILTIAIYNHIDHPKDSFILNINQDGNKKD